MPKLFVADSAGLARYLKSNKDMAAAVGRHAEKVAAGARDRTDLPVETDERVTDRAVVDVTITHPAGAAEQAKHGVLTQAAAEAGLEVRPPKRRRR